MRYFLSRGFILRKQPSGENDHFLTIFSPEGKLQAKSRGSRKITSQKGGHLDLLNLCEFQFYRNGEHLLITEIKVENAFPDLKTNLDKSLLALNAAEIILKSFQTDQENKELFQLFQNFLERLQNTIVTTTFDLIPQLLLEEFKIKTLKQGGSWPEISLCHFCQNKWQNPENILIDQQGQLTCPDCLKKNDNQLQKFSFPIIKLANFLAIHSLQALNLKITREELFQLQKLTSIFLSNYLQQELKSSRLLNSGI